MVETSWTFSWKLISNEESVSGISGEFVVNLRRVDSISKK
jgi:hypothetical protein